jgi:hypothetical protein
MFSGAGCRDVDIHIRNHWEFPADFAIEVIHRSRELLEVQF